MISEVRAATTISRLSKNRLFIVAPITDDAWKTRQDVIVKEFVQRAFRLSDSKMVLVKDGEILYIPEHPLDWEGHPAAHVGMEIIIFQAEDPYSPVRVNFLRPNTVFFFIPRERAIAVAEGRQTELDLLRDLERNLSYPA